MLILRFNLDLLDGFDRILPSLMYLRPAFCNYGFWKKSLPEIRNAAGRPSAHSYRNIEFLSDSLFIDLLRGHQVILRDFEV